MSFYDDASLVFLPSGGAGKDTKAYSIKPTDGSGDFTFSRGSNLTATRVDSNGLIEKGRENLLLQSNQFDTTWVTNSTSITSGQSGYDGSSDAWLLTKTGSYGQLQQSLSAFSGVHTFSVYIKAGDSNWARVRVGSAPKNSSYFDLQNGVIGASGTTPIDSNIENIGGGWYRCSITTNISASIVYVYPAEGDGLVSSTSGSIYIQDAQLEIGLIATEPILSGATKGKAGILEHSPRFDYSGGASCPSLLLERSMTNEIGYSEYFEGWTPQGSPTITSNYGTSPEGLQNSSRLRYTTDSDYIETSVTNTSGVFTIYAKGTGNLILTDSGANASSTTALTSSYQRIELYFSTNTTTLQIKTDSSGLDAEVYGAQFENATYKTSYIPNHSGGSVTREADSNVASGLSSVIGQTEGTIFCELDIDNLTDGYRRIIGISDGTNDTSIQLNLSSSGRLEAYINEQGTYSVIYYGPTLATGIQRLAITYKGNEARIYRNGTLLTTDTSVVVPACSNLYLGKTPTASITSIIGNKIKQALLFDTALSDEDCITLTTL